MSDTALHTKYRPTSLDKLIGHEEAVTRMKGMISSGKIPSAILITGPTSVGKTTIARAFVSDLNGSPDFIKSPDYREINVGDQRSIDDIRDLVRLSKLRPMVGKKKVFLLDEAQSLLSSSSAASACLLKPLEESSKDTLWILCSMDPSKFNTGNGRAIKNRCVQFVLEPHTNKDLFKQAMRIIRGEKMDYLLTEDKGLIKTLIKNANFEMRTLAQILEACQQYYNGLSEKPETLSVENIAKVLSTMQASDDRLAYEYLVGIYKEQYKQAVKAVLNCSDGMALLNKVVYMSNYILNSAVLNGERNSKVWGTPIYREAQKAIGSVSLGEIADVNTQLIHLKSEAMQFNTSVDMLMSAYAYEMIKRLQGLRK